MHEFETTPPNSPYKFPSSISQSIKLKRQSSLHYKRTQQYHPSQHEQMHKQHPNKHSQNYDLIKQSSDPVHSNLHHSTLVTDSLMFASNGQKHHQHPQQKQPPISPLPSPSSQQQRRQSISNEVSSETSAATTALCCDSTTTDTSRPSSSDWRRQAMHITSNPSYQVSKKIKKKTLRISATVSVITIFINCTYCLNKRNVIKNLRNKLLVSQSDRLAAMKWRKR